MRDTIARRFPTWPLVAACFVAAAAAAATPASAPDSPFTRLYDTVALVPASLPANAAFVSRQWKPLAEGDLMHAFAGDAAFMNGQLAIVLNSARGQADLYSRSMERWCLRVRLGPADGNGLPAAKGLTDIRIVENSPAATAVEAAFKVADGNLAIFRFRLAAGAFFLEVRGGTGASALAVIDDSSYVVVPDYFGDDLVFDCSAAEPIASAAGSSDVALPTDNVMLHLVDKGQAVVACVWGASTQRAWLRVQPSAAGPVCTIDMKDGNSFWLAVCEGKDIWHASALLATGPNAPSPLDWKPPMPAQWRASLAVSDFSARSWTFAEANDPGGDDRPCRFDAGRAWICLPASPALAKATVVVYPIDRRKATPLDVFLLTDLMRETLGVGPCQYVLDAEGLGSAEAATVESVTAWIEKQLERKPARRQAEDIADRLAAMVRQVEAQQDRIEDYRRFARRVVEICQSSATSDRTGSPARMLAVAAGMAETNGGSSSGPRGASPSGQKLGVGPQNGQTQEGAAMGSLPQLVRELAAQVLALADKDDGLQKARQPLSEIRGTAARQDYDLARLRMAVRRLSVLCPTDGSPGDSPATHVRREIWKLAANRSHSPETRPAGRP